MPEYNNLESLVFRGHKFTPVVHRETSELWFFVCEVAEILGIVNHSQAVQKAELEDDEKGISLRYTPGGMQESLIVSESGLYGLISNSRKQIGKDLRKFVRKKVLPSIRKTGKFEFPQDSTEQALILARNLIEMSTKIKAVENQRDLAIQQKAQVSAGREGTLLSRLGNLSTIEQVIKIISESCEVIDGKNLLKVTDVAKSVRFNLGVKKLPLCINEILCEMNLQEFCGQEVRRKIKGRWVTFNIKYRMTNEGELLGEYKHTGILSRNTEITTSINWDHSLVEKVIEFLKSCQLS